MNVPVYPIYRRYLNGMSVFKINGPEHFEEIRKLGSRWIWSEHPVKILPERNFVNDLTFHFADFAEEVDAADFESLKAKWKA